MHGRARAAKPRLTGDGPLGHNDLLIFTKPDMVKDIHKECFLAGSDICETNAFDLQRHHGVRPTSRTLSLSPGVEDLSCNATWDELVRPIRSR